MDTGKSSGPGRKASPALVDHSSFNTWLRTQLRVRRLSQRQLARYAGVEHSTISRLVRGREPSLATARKLARALGELPHERETPGNSRTASSPSSHPIARVEYALRLDDALDEGDVRRVMHRYLAVRAQRGSGDRQHRQEGPTG